MFNNKIEVLINLFTFHNGEIKILLFKKQDEPFKGYWMLPSNLMLNKETLDECVSVTLTDRGITDVYKETCDVYTKVDRIPETRIVGISVLAVTNNISLNTKDEYEWFNINNIPKTIYDNGYIIENTIKKLKEELLNTKFLKIFLSNSFTLPELQKLFEHVLNKKLDRRNFRKKILNFDIIEDTNEKSIAVSGRPAKLYSFKNIKDRRLFNE